MKCPKCGTGAEFSAKTCEGCNYDFSGTRPGSRGQRFDFLAGLAILVGGIGLVGYLVVSCFGAVSRWSDRGYQEWADSVAKANGPHQSDEILPTLSSMELIGMCAHNRSDNRLLGRVTAVSGRNTTSTGAYALGQKVLTVRLVPELRKELGDKTMMVTYPRNATVTTCAD